MELWKSLDSLRCKKQNEVLEAIKMYSGNVIKERSNLLIKNYCSNFMKYSYFD